MENIKCNLLRESCILIFLRTCIITNVIREKQITISIINFQDLIEFIPFENYNYNKRYLQTIFQNLIQNLYI